jgi:hypothetical protein
VSVTVTSGTVNVTVASGASVSAGLLGSSGFTLSGSLAQLNASLATLAYSPDANFAGGDTLVISSADASALSDADTVTLTVSPVDDAPVLTGVTLSVSQGGSVTLAPADFTIVDIDGPGGTRLVDVRNLAGGLFELVSAPGVALSTFAYADVVAGLVRFVHSGSSSPPAFEASVRDSVTPGTYVAASVGFTPTPVLIVPGPTPEQVYSVVLTNPGTTTPPAPANPGTSAPPSQATSTGTATQRQNQEESSGSQGARGPGEVDPRILMTMATLRTPHASAAPAAEPGAATVAVAVVAPSTPAAKAGVSDLTPMPTGVAPIPAQVDPIQAVSPSTEQAGWEMSAPLSVDPPPAAADETRRQSEEEQQFDIMVNGVRLTGVSLSVGVVTWALRAGGILSSLLASLPAWRYVDPLPILERAERGRVAWRKDEDDIDATPEGSDARTAERAVTEMLEGRS